MGEVRESSGLYKGHPCLLEQTPYLRTLQSLAYSCLANMDLLLSVQLWVDVAEQRELKWWWSHSRIAHMAWNQSCCVCNNGLCSWVVYTKAGNRARNSENGQKKKITLCSLALFLWPVSVQISCQAQEMCCSKIGLFPCSFVFLSNLCFFQILNYHMSFC